MVGCHVVCRGQVEKSRNTACHEASERRRLWNVAPERSKLPEWARLTDACRVFWTGPIRRLRQFDKCKPRAGDQWAPADWRRRWRPAAGAAETRSDQIIPCVESAHLCWKMGKMGKDGP
jgi:hypothetical protein